MDSGTTVLLCYPCLRAVMDGEPDPNPPARGMGSGMAGCDQCGMAMCDRCGKNLGWQEGQASTVERWRLVQQALDLMAKGCAVCWVGRGQDAAEYLHSRRDCTWKGEYMSEDDCEQFRRLIVFERDSDSCPKCGISQQLCMMGRDDDSSNCKGDDNEEVMCKWPNILAPVILYATWSPVGHEVMRRLGYGGKMPGEGSELLEWREYGRWLGQRHRRQMWGRWVSNAMAALGEVIMYICNGRSPADLQG